MIFISKFGWPQYVTHIMAESVGNIDFFLYNQY